MTPEDEINLEMRLSALEYITCKAYSALVLAQTGSIEAAKTALTQLGEGADKQMFPGLDAAMSDLANAEWTEAVRRLIKMQINLLEQAAQSK